MSPATFEEIWTSATQISYAVSLKDFFWCVSHAIPSCDAEAFCFHAWRVVAIGSAKCLFVEVFFTKFKGN